MGALFSWVAAFRNTFPTELRSTRRIAMRPTPMVESTCWPTGAHPREYGGRRKPGVGLLNRTLSVQDTRRSRDAPARPGFAMPGPVAYCRGWAGTWLSENSYAVVQGRAIDSRASGRSCHRLSAGHHADPDRRAVASSHDLAPETAALQRAVPLALLVLQDDVDDTR